MENNFAILDLRFFRGLRKATDQNTSC